MGTRKNAAALVNDERNDLETMNNEETQSQCKALAKSSGEQCRNKPSPSSEYCHIHRQMSERRAQQANTERTSPEKKAKVAKRPDNWPLNDPTWRQQAFFMLFFGHVTDEHEEQVWHTCVYHDESGEQKGIDDAIVQENFAGVAFDPWVDWILERAKLHGAEEPIPTEIEAATSPTSVTPYDIQVEILDADVNQSSVAPGKRLVAEAHFKISGLEAETLMKKEIPFEILFHAVNCESGAANLVASEQGQLKPQKRKYRGEQEFIIPVLGDYELETIILLLPPGEIMAFRLRDSPFSVIPR